MSPATVIQRNPDIIAAAVGEETILLNAVTWTYVHFNETAAKIWECLDRPRSVGEIVATLTADYAIDADACAREVQEFAEGMSGRGFIQIAA